MEINKAKKLMGMGLIVMSVSSVAQAGEWNAGLNVGQSSLTPDAEQLCNQVADGIATRNNVLRSIFSCDADDSDTSIGINIAYNFSKRWGVELGYIDLGEETSTISARSGFFVSTGTSTADIVRADYSAIYLVATGSWILSDKWSVTGRFGAANVEFDAALPAIDDAVSDDTSEAMAGFSVNYHFNAKWSADLRYDYFDTEESIDNFSLGVRYNF